MHCVACDAPMGGEIWLDYDLTEVGVPKDLPRGTVMETLCNRCLGKVKRAEDMIDFDDGLEGFYFTARAIKYSPIELVYPAPPYYPWEFTYV